MSHAKPQLEVNGLTIAYSKGKMTFHAVSEVSFNIHEGETVAIVGESGCGKSSIAKAILGIAHMHAGSISYNGAPILKKNKRKTDLSVKKDIQMVFQDPYSSLNPRMTIEEIIEEPLNIFKIGSKKSRKDRVVELLNSVKLPLHFRWRYPHELSGGERQRVSIARALASDPKILVCDEPTHALDMSVQASIINLLKDLKEKHTLSLLFISHDLSLVKNISDRCLVMYGGKIVETGRTEDIFSDPKHPFTKKLLAAVPIFSMDAHFYDTPCKKKEYIPEPVSVDSKVLHSYVRDLQESMAYTTKQKYSRNIYSGKCPYLTRCKERKPICESKEIHSVTIADEHYALCHLASQTKSKKSD